MAEVYDRYVGQFEIYQAEINNGQEAYLENFNSFQKEHQEQMEYNQDIFLNKQAVEKVK